MGQSVQEFRKVYPEARVWSFEPIKASYEKLVETVDDAPMVSTHMMALGDRPTTVTMSNSGTSPGNRVINPGELKNTLEITLTTGDEFCALNGISNIDFLKIDAEGFDLKVVVGFADMLRSRKIHVVQMEVGIALENSRHVPLNAAAAFMNAFGYRLFRLPGVVAEGRERRPALFGGYYCDAVFVRHPPE